MTVFSRTWNGAYEGTPAGTSAANALDTAIQQFKTDVRERLEVEHYWAGDVDDGAHKLPYITEAARDALSPNAGNIVIQSDTTGLSIYNGSAWVELYPFAVGDIKLASYDSAHGGWLKCDGADVSQTTYAALWAVFGDHIFGADPGGGDFTLPDLQSLVPVGFNAADPNFAAIGDTAGADEITLTTAQLASHVHGGVTDGEDAHTHAYDAHAIQPGASGFGAVGNSAALVTSNTSGAGSSHTHNFTSNTAGSGDAHPNLQPSLALNYYIKT